MVFAVKHNDAHRFNDLKKGAAPELDFSNKRILKITKYRTKKTSDILKRSECAPSLMAYVDKNRPVRQDPLSVIEPLEIPESALDIRPMEPLAAIRTYPDIFMPAFPVPKRIARYAKKHRKFLIKSGLSTALAVTVLIGGTVGAVSYAQTGVEKAYGELFSLKTLAAEGPEAFADGTQSADNQFSKLKLVLAPVSAAFDSPVLSVPSVRTAGHVIRGGGHLAEAAKIVAGIWKDYAAETSEYPDLASALGSGSTFKATDFVESHFDRIRQADTEISSALAEYSKIESLGNPEYDAKFKTAVTTLVEVQGRLRFVMTHEGAILAALGHQSPQRYLILNQNRDELRATGGFPGSAVFVEFYKGRLSKYEKKDIYYYDWHLFPYAEKAPAGLDKISDKWGLRDANYYPEMERNFRTMDAFYQKSGGSSLNGIMVMNQGIVTDLLAKYGPVRMEKIGKSVDASNFSTLMSVLVENKIAKTYSPKDVLFDFVTELEKTLKEKKDYAGYLEVLSKNAESGEILAYSDDAEVNDLFTEVFPGEKSKTYGGNFAYPVFTSISGNKSDRYVHRTFEVKTQAVEGCKVLNEFRLESDHAMSVDDKEKIRGLLYDLGVPPDQHEKQIFIQGNGDNRQYVRVLVPKGSKLSGKPPIEVDVDDSMPDYTVFAFYITTVPGQKSAAFFDYESEPKDCSKKSTFYAQPGLQNYTVKSE